MVQAILEGRKSMTRRVVKPSIIENHPGWHWESDIKAKHVFAPYQPGDVLWVRETWAKREWSKGRYYYKATPELGWCNREGDRWRPSIFMPREAARIFLRVKAVRAERVQEITEADALDEGYPNYTSIVEYERGDARGWFMNYWDELNAKRGYTWAMNPWVWAVYIEKGERQ